MTTTQNILGDLEKFENSPENEGYDLRLDLADIILQHLDGNKWTQARLAEAAGMKDSYLTRVIHSSQNCTFDGAGRILHALGVKAKLREVEPEGFSNADLCSNSKAFYLKSEASNGENPYQKTAIIGPAYSERVA
jgi:hypothetical protein